MSVGRTVWLRDVAPRPRPPDRGRERAWWYFMRISGLALVVLALGHMLIMHVLVALAGQEVDFALVNSRWGTPFWRFYDGLLLVLAMLHGINGARTVISDLVERGGIRSALLLLLAVVAVLWIALGLAVIVFFQPTPA